MDAIIRFRIRRMFRVDGRKDGGPGSGHWGHMGVPGKRGGSLPRKTSVNSVSYVENNPKKKETDPDKGKNISSPDNQKKYIQVKKVKNGKTIGGEPDTPKKGKKTSTPKASKPKVSKPKVSKPKVEKKPNVTPSVTAKPQKSKPSVDTMALNFGITPNMLKHWLGI